MASLVHHVINGNTFWLLSQKAVFWEERKAVILSDLHLGKTGHFRKEGVPVPQAVYKDDLHRLFHIIQHYKPEQVIIAGDMFHSRMNREVDLFTRWRRDIAQLHILLVRGNHDILHDEHYREAGIALAEGSVTIDGFCFVHDINDISNAGEPAANNHQPYYFSGHVHPGIVLKSGSRQSVCLPCYYFGNTYAVLPAFSAFTGMYPITPKKRDSIFAILKDSVMKVG
ncbi:MAG TPA: ligase-associated DNA damage response endonuclease PdeM [Chitinophagaceae bacterium]|nr:ligase-associated DNA damage response endonuclease PdeM [Chitinophagaceae bacterium]